MVFAVQVSCCGAQWFLYAPAFGVCRFVSDKNAIRAQARDMIAQCSAAPAKFEVDLELGRVVDKAEITSLRALISESWAGSRSSPK
ncbi:hypothetical protein [Nocardia carnea]|uniref:hypothetical protein n=1 Tax=Nocardia carnea TaxID=37328 RepID=UPI002457B1ED|nr:hypothetical protein [Nocardia carnea]